MIYDRENFYQRQKELLDRIEILRKYYKSDVVDYLIRLANLDECILKDEAFLDEFGSMDLVYDLMKFNLLGRMYRVIDKDHNLIQRRIKSNDCLDAPRINYLRGDNIPFEIVNCDFRRKVQFSGGREKKPNIILKEITDRSEESIESLERQMEKTKENIKLLSSEISSLESEQPKTSFWRKKNNIVGVYDKKGILDIKMEEYERLKRQLEKVKKYGHLESEVCNEVTDIILDDFAIDKSEFVKSMNRSLIKEYKYIDILRRQR